MGFSTRLFVVLAIALLLSAGGAFFFPSNNALAFEHDSVCEENSPLCAGTTRSWTETQYRCTSNTCGAQKLARTRSCSEGENTTQASVCTEAGWSSPVCQSFSSCGAWAERIVDQDPYMVCSGSTQWTESEPLIFCSAQQCYPIPEIKTLQDNDLFPKNVFETGTNKIKLPVNVGWSSINTVLEEEDSICRADSYEYQITGASGTYAKNVLSSVRICDTIQECKDVWEEAREREDVSAMNRAKAIADEIRKKVTDPTGSIPIHDNEPSSQYPTYNFLTGQYDYVLAHQQEVTQDVVRRAFEACVLNPGTSYQLRVRACSDKDGTDCQKWDSTNLLSFSTSLAPELISPYDPDWEGPNSSTIDLSDETQIPIRFQWCDTMQQHASSFLLQTSASYPPDSPQATKKERLFGRESTGFASIPGSLEELLLNVSVEYFWRLIPCSGGSCDPKRSSQTWSLTPITNFSQPQPLTPDGATLNMTNSLGWARIPGAEYYLVHIEGLGLNTTRAVQALSFPLSKEFWIPNLQMSSSYTWRVAGCGGSISNNPELCVKEGLEEIAWSQQRTFYTTGNAPKHVEFSPLNREGGIAIPVSATWRSETMSAGVQGAASYYYAITAGQTRISGFSNEPSIALTYAQGMRPATAYQLEVRTCAEEMDSLSLGQENEFCGPAKIVEFSTLAQPDPPIITAPGTNTAVRPSIAWDSSFGSNYYAYEVVYKEMIEEPNTQLCSPLVGSVVVSNKNNITLGTSYPTNLQCFGSYTLRVLGCIDTDTSKTQCIEQGEVASHTFTIGASSTPTGFGGLVPCGRENFNRDTPWDDREPCGIQHVFLGLWTLLNFVLWRLTPILLVLGAMATGVALYFLSYNAPELLAQIKSGWKAFGVGILIMLFSWFLLNLLLGLLGFDVTIFGRWYEVVF